MPPKCVAFLFVHFGVSSIDSQRPQTKEQATAEQWSLIYFEAFGRCFFGQMKFIFSNFSFKWRSKNEIAGKWNCKCGFKSG